MKSFCEYESKVHADWVDYNGHMNVAYYVLVFDQATDCVLEKLELGAQYRNEVEKSLFVVESHVTYDQEVHEDDLLMVKSHLIGIDQKRIHIFHEMYRSDTQEKCATNEIMTLHVDMNSRKTVDFSSDCMDRLLKAKQTVRVSAKLSGLGRAIRKLQE